MMGEIYPDIPRIHTALAEVTACILFVLMLKQGKKVKHFVPLSVLFYLWQCVYLMVTKDLPVSWWVPCMAGALGFMYLYLVFLLRLSSMASAYFACRAFILAEFAASVEWQIVCFFRWYEDGCRIQQMIALLVTYGCVFAVSYLMEHSIYRYAEAAEISLQEFLASFFISALVFALSNLSFVTTDALFTSGFQRDIFNIRTLVDLAGIMILYAFQSRMTEVKAERELASINAMLKTQYDKYRSYQDSIDLINMKYHDLKHQLEGMRATMTSEERNQWVDSLEKELQSYSPSLQTGNQVLDALLDSKIVVCRKKDIQFTCIAEGALLNFIYVTDLCTIFGNALDNAIENTVLIEDPEKRLIHLTVTAKKNFVYIFIENYCTSAPGMKDGYPMTTKTDKENHGFGIKSICYTVEKYDGTVKFSVENSWFFLKILIPMPEKG